MPKSCVGKFNGVLVVFWNSKSISASKLDLRGLSRGQFSRKNRRTVEVLIFSARNKQIFQLKWYVLIFKNTLDSTWSYLNLLEALQSITIATTDFQRRSLEFRILRKGRKIDKFRIRLFFSADDEIENFSNRYFWLKVKWLDNDYKNRTLQT